MAGARPSNQRETHLPDTFGLDSRLKSGTGVLFLRLFLLACPAICSAATSVIIRPPRLEMILRSDQSVSQSVGGLFPFSDAFLEPKTTAAEEEEEVI